MNIFSLRFGVLILANFVIGSFMCSGQSIAVLSTTGLSTYGLYPTLKVAFDSINSGYHAGSINIQVLGNTTEPSSGASLDSSGSIKAWGVSSYTDITIKPIGGSWTISGTITAGNPLVNLNGADYVTIDGQANGLDSLTFNSTTVSTTSGTATIRLINDAQHNVIKRCNIISGATVSVTTNGGAVFISTAASGGSGNDNNTISDCFFFNTSLSNTSFVYKYVFINGTTTNSNLANSNIIINNNHFINFRSTGVYVNAGSRDITISNNHFYHTVVMATSTIQYTPIFISSTTSGIGENFNITTNYIGGSAPLCGGTKPTPYISTSTSAVFQLIYLGCATSALSTVYGNKIANINLQVAYTGTETALIYIKTGKVKVDSNFMGSLTDTNNITIVHNASSGGNYAFITVGGNSAGTFDTVLVTNNRMGGITLSAAGSNTPSFRGYDNSGTTGTHIIRNNFFGIPGVPHSIIVNGNNGNAFSIIFRNSSSATHECVSNYIGNWTFRHNGSLAGKLSGIFSFPGRLDSNTIENLMSFTNLVGSSANNSANGITVGAFTKTCIGNRIKNIIAAHPTAVTRAIGIDITGNTGSANAVIAGNIISNVYSLSSDSSTIIGMRLNGDTATNFKVHNNQISLGKDSLGNDITTGYNIYGILRETGKQSLFFNSVSLVGLNTAIRNNTYAIYSESSGTADIRNNVFSNQRGFVTTPVNTINCAALYNGQITSGTVTGLISNFNLYFAPYLGGGLLRNNGTDYLSISSWQTVAFTHDLNSINGDPNFISYANLSGGNPSAITYGDGTTGIAIDITNATRSRNLMGAYDYSINLPVQLIMLNAAKSGDDVRVSWSTASEKNNKGFEIQRSTDQLTFETVGFVKGNGTSGNVVSYAFTDRHVFSMIDATNIYYRLKQIDFDGAYAYSDIVSVSNNINNKPFELLTYPNPFNAEIRVSTKDFPITSIVIKDITGREMHVTTSHTNNNEMVIITDELFPGVYFITVTQNGKTTTRKAVKK